MICPTCYGEGIFRVVVEGDGLKELPCPQCGGCGFAHCCEGERPDCIKDNSNDD